jgi:hypothetical protein
VSWRDWFDKHFDKLLLSALFLAGLAIHMHFARELAFYSNTTNVSHISSTVNWLENTVGQILAALLTLMVGRSLTQPQSSATVSPGGKVEVTTGPQVSPKPNVITPEELDPER